MAQVITAPNGGEGKTLYMRTTFGILASQDGGRHFEWLCEEALGFSSLWDPPIAVNRAGDLYLGLEDGLRVSRGGCPAEPVASLDGQLVSDLSVEPDGQRIIAITASGGRAVDGGTLSADKQSRIFRQGADGAFVAVGAAPPSFRFDTIDVASRGAADLAPPPRGVDVANWPARLYATGVNYAARPYAHFFRSDDGGRTLEDTHPVVPEDGTMFLSAIDPRNPNRLFVRLIRQSDGGTDVLLSEDGGKTFRVVLSRPTPLYGFALTGKGEVAYAAAGDPSVGLLRSSDSGKTWETVHRIGLKCLFAASPDKAGQSSGPLFGCANSLTKTGPQIVRLDDRGERATLLGGFPEITGPSRCKGVPIPACVAAWPKVARRLSADAGVVDDDDEPAGDAGASGPVANPSAASASAPSPQARQPSRSCGCGSAGGDELLGQLSVVCIFAGVVARRRQRPRAYVRPAARV
jgi:hypothetical protein